MKTALTIIFVIVSVIITVLVMCQESKDNGLGSLAGGAAAGETYWGKNKGRSIEGKLVLFTKILAIAFIVIAAILNINF